MTSTWLKMPQERLGRNGLLVLLVMTSLAMPLSLDMYTPAIPHMAANLSTTKELVNLTLVGYNLFFAVGLLVFGPLSDRRGRRPVLLGGAVTFTVASAACALAPNVWVLIVARIVQSLGAGAADAMTNSIAKDSFRYNHLQVALSFIQLMLIIGPVIAPIVGALIVSLATWRDTFWVLTAIGAACAFLAVAFQETLPEGSRATGEGAGTLHQFAEVLRMPSFTRFSLVFSVFGFGFMAYVAIASYVYEAEFGLSAMGYSFYYALSALLTMAGPFSWELFHRRMSARRFLTLQLVTSIASAVLVLAFGRISPVAFFLCFSPFAICEAAARPLTVRLLLSQRDDMAGTASSAVNFLYTGMGSVGMVVVHLPQTDYVTALGTTLLGSLVVATLGWVALLRSDVRVAGLDEGGGGDVTA